MGYTHYWTIRKPGELPSMKAALSNMLLIIQKAKARGIALEGTVLTDIATGDVESFDVNSAAPLSYEPFVFPNGGPRGERDFCKTEHKPYDVVVVACLATAKYFLGRDIKVESDGRRHEWEEGCELARAATGLNITNPIEDDE